MMRARPNNRLRRTHHYTPKRRSKHHVRRSLFHRSRVQKEINGLLFAVPQPLSTVNSMKTNQPYRILLTPLIGIGLSVSINTNLSAQSNSQTQSKIGRAHD